MCGINVIVDKRSQLSAEVIGKMSACTAHRGPDYTGSHTSRAGAQTIFAGHNRLSIIDRSPDAHQPFASADGRYLLLFNGAICNFRELRQELSSRFQFRTQSDTEVVLALLVVEGPAALHRLNGMFAIVFIDTHTGHLTAARDRFGIKPLYYAHTADYLLLSSELHAIHQSGLVPKELNAEQLQQYLRYKSARKPATFFRQLQELEEGQLLEYTGQELHLRSYLPEAPQSPAEPLSADTLLRHTEELLQQAVERQLVADVPVGLFLSGGTDSTLLLALLQERGHTHFPTFSINHAAEEQSFGTLDRHFAPLAAERFGADHTSFPISEDVLQLFPQVISALDQPIADSAALLTYFISREARKHVTVALSGAGADELFAGYNRHWAFFRYLQHRTKLTSMAPLLKAGSKLLPTGIHHPLRRQFQLLQKLVPNLSHSARQTFLNFTALQLPVQRLLQHPQREPQHRRQDDKDESHGQLLRWALHHDQHQYLISDILALTDKTSMRHGLEVRVPYLDNDLAQLLQTVPPHLLFSKGRKWLLRDLLRQRGGEVFADRAKEGFGLPIGTWLRKPANAWLLEPLQEPGNLLFAHLHFEPVQRLLKAQQQGRKDMSVELWGLIVLAHWLRKEFG